MRRHRGGLRGRNSTRRASAASSRRKEPRRSRLPPSPLRPTFAAGPRCRPSCHGATRKALRRAFFFSVHCMINYTRDREREREKERRIRDCSRMRDLRRLLLPSSSPLSSSSSSPFPSLPAADSFLTFFTSPARGTSRSPTCSRRVRRRCRRLYACTCTCALPRRSSLLTALTPSPQESRERRRSRGSRQPRRERRRPRKRARGQEETNETREGEGRAGGDRRRRAGWLAGKGVLYRERGKERKKERGRWIFSECTMILLLLARRSTIDSDIIKTAIREIRQSSRAREREKTTDH